MATTLPSWAKFVSYGEATGVVTIAELVEMSQVVDHDGLGISQRQIYYYLQPGDPSIERMAAEAMRLRTALLLSASLLALTGQELSLRDFDLHSMLEYAGRLRR